ncbi:MAG: DUF4143 domain-containing protein, partial [Bdellovibrionota bacterium]
DLRLHPITVKEAGESFRLGVALQTGCLPKILSLALEEQMESARLLLRGYNTIYIKEEIQAEALVRSLDGFQRFLPIAAQSNAQVIEFMNIGRECSVPANTVKSYYSILEDTLIGRFVWPMGHSERKKARPKFYFFDCGVARALQGRLSDPPTPSETGFLFETWFLHELVCIRDYGLKDDTIAFWRHGRHEVDFVICRSGQPRLAFECKSGIHPDDYQSAIEFKRRFPSVPLYFVSYRDAEPRKTERGFEIMPWKTALEIYR